MLCPGILGWRAALGGCFCALTFSERWLESALFFPTRRNGISHAHLLDDVATPVTVECGSNFLRQAQRFYSVLFL